jgi:hypothetical protein
MTYDEDGWTPWIEHDGAKQPVPDWEIVEAFDLEGDFYEADRADTLGWDWSDDVGVMGWIVRFRIRKPRGLTILEEVARQPERELV